MRDDAASPLTVIVVFVLVAIGITSLIVWLLVDTANPLLELQEQGDGFTVSRTAGGIAWSDLEVAFLDRAGVDRADVYLEVPTGPLEQGDRIALRETPPGGTYVLIVTLDGEELVRLTYDV